MKRFNEVYNKIISEERFDENIIKEKINYTIELEINGLKQYLMFYDNNLYQITGKFNNATKSDDLQDVINILNDLKKGNIVVHRGLISKNDIVHFSPEDLEKAKILKISTIIKVEAI